LLLFLTPSHFFQFFSRYFYRQCFSEFCCIHLSLPFQIHWTCLVVLVVYVPYWILVGTLRHLIEFSVVTRPLHLIKTKKNEHTSDDDDDDDEIVSDSGGMVLRVVAPLPLATVMASPLASTSPPGGGAGAAASGH
jgi:hypothetical protein